MLCHSPGDTFNDGLDHGLARFTPTAYNEIGSRSFWPNNNFLENLQFNNNVLMQRGSHAIKFGVEYRRSNVFREAQSFRRGQFACNGIFTVERPNDATSRANTGNGMADFLLGTASSTTVGNQNGEDIYNPYWGLFIQDDWKVSRNLTVNAGSRNFDLMLGKRFVLPWEGHGIQFRFEAFNLTNTPTFGQPASGLRAANTGTITEADEPRRLQFALKYAF